MTNNDTTAERDAIVTYVEKQARQAKEYGFPESSLLLFALAKDLKRGDHLKETQHGG